MKTEQNIRPSPIAGQWYTSNRQRLAQEIDEYINNASIPKIPGEVIAVMAPHAGHRYSGRVAGYAFAALTGLKPDIVAVISPMHHPYYQPLLTTAHTGYYTPLGEIAIAQDALDELDQNLVDRLGYVLTRVTADPEHSLEIELPFLQRALPDRFELLPVMVRDQSANTARGLAMGLAKTLNERNAILVASTDLSHFYPQHVANKLDSEVLRRVEAYDPQGVLDAELQGVGFACGRGALAAVMWAAKELGANHAQVLKYATSGDVTGDYTEVVGYGAAVFSRVA